MKSILKAVAVTLALAACAVAEVPSAKATIPFEFRVGAKLFPAGEYYVWQDVRVNAVMLRNTDSGTAVSAISNAVMKVNRFEAPAQLQFRRYGNKYFLAQVWMVNSPLGRELPPSASERETARGAGREIASVRLVKQ